MQWFCYKLGIKCTKPYTPREDMFFVPGHTWNIVQLEGEDYLVDATWGYNWFFITPKRFIDSIDHFPSKPEQQLLEEPITLEEFKKMKGKKIIRADYKIGV